MFVFKTLWQQSDGWKSVLAAAQEDAAHSREVALQSQAEAAAAREAARVAHEAADAAHASAQEALLAAERYRQEERHCQTCLAEMESRIHALQDQLNGVQVEVRHPDGD